MRKLWLDRYLGWEAWIALDSHPIASHWPIDSSFVSSFVWSDVPDVPDVPLYAPCFVPLGPPGPRGCHAGIVCGVGRHHGVRVQRGELRDGLPGLQDQERRLPAQLPSLLSWEGGTSYKLWQTLTIYKLKISANFNISMALGAREVLGYHVLPFMLTHRWYWGS